MLSSKPQGLLENNTLMSTRFFIGGPLADYLGRRWGMGIGCFITVIATFMQTFAPRGKLGVFIAGRVLIGIGQGTALTAGPVYIGERRSSGIPIIS